MTELTDREKRIIDFERAWFKHQGAKEEMVRAIFGLSAITYYQTVSALLDRREAIEYDRATVMRLRRARDRAIAKRAHRRRGH